MIVGLVPCVSSAWREEPKEIGRVESVLFVTCSQHLPQWNLKQVSWPQPVGSMLRGVHFDGPGRLTGVVNTLKSFHLLRPHSTFLHHLAHRVRSARMTGGVGRIGLRAMPGSVHRTRASSWLGFLHTSPHTLEEERASTEQLTTLSFPPNILAGRRSFVPFSFLHHAFFNIRRRESIRVQTPTPPSAGTLFARTRRRAIQPALL